MADFEHPCLFRSTEQGVFNSSIHVYLEILSKEYLIQAEEWAMDI